MLVLVAHGQDKKEQSHEGWLVDRIKEATSIKPGTPRAAFLKVFDEQGGLQPIPADRYVLKSCTYIKVKVHFQKDKVTDISEPYLGFFIAD